MHRVPDFKLLAEINNIISEIESELNQLNTVAKKHLANSVYMLGNNYLNVESDNHKKGDKYYAFIIKKSFWMNKITLELLSSLSTSENPSELPKVKFKTDDYRLYKLKSELHIFDTESLVKIKRFLLSFSEVES